MKKFEVFAPNKVPYIQTADTKEVVAQCVDIESARLMAMAPEMANALELLVRYEGSTDNEGLYYQAIAYATAKRILEKIRSEG